MPNICSRDYTGLTPLVINSIITHKLSIKGVTTRSALEINKAGNFKPGDNNIRLKIFEKFGALSQIRKNPPRYSHLPMVVSRTHWHIEKIKRIELSQEVFHPTPNFF